MVILSSRTEVRRDDTRLARERKAPDRRAAGVLAGLARALVIALAAAGCAAGSASPEARPAPGKARGGQATNPSVPREVAAMPPHPSSADRPASAGAVDCDLGLGTTFAAVRRTLRWDPPDAARRAQVADVFRKVLAGRDGDPSALLAEAVRGLVGSGYAVRRTDCGTAAVLVFEQVAPGAGGGLFAVRIGRLPREVVVQAPHRFFDARTGAIAQALFAEQPIRALYANTWHRNGAAGQGGPVRGEHDVAHAPESLFQDLTDAAAATLPSPLVVQVHGFNEKDSPSGTVLIVSDGTKAGGPVVDRAAAALQALYGPRAALRYGRDTSDLGATTNRQGAAVRARAGSFLHVELSGPERERLETDAAQRQRFAAALGIGAAASDGDQRP